MRYQEIREAFKKCGVIVNQSGVTLVFNKYDPTRWITQSIDGEEIKNIRVFQNLVRDSKEMAISLYPGRYAGFSFGIDLPMDAMRVFAPVQDELTPEEYRRLVLMDPPENPDSARDFWEFLKTVDLSDDHEVLQGLSDFIEEHSEVPMLSLPAVRRWSKVEPIARGFARSNGFHRNCFTPPGKELEFGMIDFYFDTEVDRVFKIKNESMTGFWDIVSLSSGFSLEAGVTDSDASFVFSVFV